MGTLSGESSGRREVVAEGLTLSAKVSRSFADRSRTSLSIPELKLGCSASCSEIHGLIESSAIGKVLGMDRAASENRARTGEMAGSSSKRDDDRRYTCSESGMSGAAGHRSSSS